MNFKLEKLDWSIQKDPNQEEKLQEGMLGLLQGDIEVHQVTPTQVEVGIEDIGSLFFKSELSQGIVGVDQETIQEEEDHDQDHLHIQIPEIIEEGEIIHPKVGQDLEERREREDTEKD